MAKFVLDKAENIVGKEKKCWLPVFFPFPTVFSALSKTNSGQIQTDVRTHAWTHPHTPNYCCNNYVLLTASMPVKNLHLL